MIGGAKLKPLDPRTFSHSQVFGTTQLPEEDFVVAWMPRKKQDLDDDCTAASVVKASSAQEGLPISESFQFHIIKNKIDGNANGFGASIPDALKSAIKFGSLPLEKDLKTLNVKDRHQVLNATYSYEHFKEARLHAKAAYFNADGYKDTFDAIRGTLWMHREYNRVGITGVYWRPAWTSAAKGIISDVNWPEDNSTPHCPIVIGQKKINGEWHLIVDPHAGEDYGDKGLFYFPRNVVNKEFTWGTFFFIDMVKEDAEWYLQNGISLNDNWIVQMLKIVRNITYKILNLDYKKEIDNKPITQEDMNEVIKELKPDYFTSFCTAIKRHEGYGTPRAITITKNFNPGALRYSVFQEGVRNGFAYFKDYQTGWKALRHQVDIVCKGMSNTYTREAKKRYGLNDCGLLDFTQFFSIFAPVDDKNDPNNYAKVVALAVGLPTTTKMRDLLA